MVWISNFQKKSVSICRLCLKRELDRFLQTIPDQPNAQGYPRAPDSKTLLDQIHVLMTYREIIPFFRLQIQEFWNIEISRPLRNHHQKGLRTMSVVQNFFCSYLKKNLCVIFRPCSVRILSAVVEWNWGIESPSLHMDHLWQRQASSALLWSINPFHVFKWQILHWCQVVEKWSAVSDTHS